ncbi:TlpA family protein disulfide reductase [Enhygromyxa salina]|uniref:Thiol-disulfide oxidoreductase ResA n=1 Tax=Enhygromyxa salina TaxID=215803 RepID=A0A2S9YU90_9BACT|nr:TlpA disulfide reductase family protein [Enhygromyxa salina]PRQ08681.1 Thiol-disulfide oxidoreductase ResA [Enhygromyxa salina]
MTDPRPSSTLQLVVGVVVVALALVTGARDLGISLDNWDSYTPVTRGDPVPQFATQLDDGTPFGPAQLEGQVSLLTFWATWCHACGLEMPTVAAIERGYAAEPGFAVYGVNRDSGEIKARRKIVAAYLADRELGFPQIYDDGQLARAFGVEQIPYMVLVDKHGNARHMHLGQVSERTLRAEIDALLAEE